jgi:hypothetical protein
MGCIPPPNLIGCSTQDSSSTSTLRGGGWATNWADYKWRHLPFVPIRLTLLRLLKWQLLFNGILFLTVFILYRIEILCVFWWTFWTLQNWRFSGDKGEFLSHVATHLSTDSPPGGLGSRQIRTLDCFRVVCCATTSHLLVLSFEYCVYVHCNVLSFVLSYGHWLQHCSTIYT